MGKWVIGFKKSHEHSLHTHPIPKPGMQWKPQALLTKLQRPEQGAAAQSGLPPQTKPPSVWISGQALALLSLRIGNSSGSAGPVRLP